MDRFDFWKSTTRLVFVPFALLSMPQQLAIVADAKRRKLKIES